MPRDDVFIAGGSEKRTGFSTAVQRFCNAVDGKTVPPNGYVSMATEVFHNNGKNPSTYGIIGFVNCKMSISTAASW
jgi:hypothetical protein